MDGQFLVHLVCANIRNEMGLIYMADGQLLVHHVQEVAPVINSRGPVERSQQSSIQNDQCACDWRQMADHNAMCAFCTKKGEI